MTHHREGFIARYKGEFAYCSKSRIQTFLKDIKPGDRQAKPTDDAGTQIAIEGNGFDNDMKSEARKIVEIGRAHV